MPSGSLLPIVLFSTAALVMPSSSSALINTFVPSHRYGLRHSITTSPLRQLWLAAETPGYASDDDNCIFVQDRCVVIQEVSLDDEDALERMSKFCIDAFYNNDSSSGQGSLITRKWKELKLAAMQKAQLLDLSLSDSSNRCIFVANDTAAGEIVGCCEIVEDRIDTRQPASNSITTSERERRKTARPRPVVENLCVRQEYRRHGVGEALVNACENAARQWQGEGEVFTQVDEDNIRAYELFRKCGYTQLFVDPTCTKLTLDRAFVGETAVTKRMMRKILIDRYGSVF